MSAKLPSPSQPSLRALDAAHQGVPAPSDWVVRFAPLLDQGARVLDYACGSGRHTRWLAERGMQVDAIDRDRAALERLRGVEGVQVRELDLEGDTWPLEGECYDAVVVTNYLHRPRFDAMLALLRPGGVLIYETFMAGNARFGKPSSPAFLLQAGELIERLRDGWTLVAFEQGEVVAPRPAVVQRVCAVKGSRLTRLP
jgi:SAM-dependent methyltransferase